MPRLKALGPRLKGALAPKLSVRKRADPFYRSADFQAWAEEVKRRFGYRCAIEACETPTDRLIAHHKHERKDGGADLDPANGVALCHRHHNAVTAANRRARSGA